MVVAAGQAATKLHHRTPRERRRGTGRSYQSLEPAPQLMGSITDIDTAGACDTCGRRTNDLQRRAGDSVCGQCGALFAAAHAVLDNDVRDEPTILGTLAFAWNGSAWAADPEDYGGLEFVSSVGGVPLLRLPRITAGIVTYDDSSIPKAGKYTRDVEPQKLAGVYERLLMVRNSAFEIYRTTLPRLRCSWRAGGAPMSTKAGVGMSRHHNPNVAVGSA